MNATCMSRPTPTARFRGRRPAIAARLELPDKTIGVMPDEDHTRGELHPAEKRPGRAVPASRDPTELGKKRMAALDRTANPPDPRRPWPAASGCLQAEAGRGRSLLAGAVAIGPVGAGVGQVAPVELGHGHLGGGRLDHQRLQHRLGLDAVVDVGGADDRAQGHAVGVAGYVDGRTTLTAIHGRRPGVFAPFFEGFLEPSRRTWSQLMPCSRA